MISTTDLFLFLIAIWAGAQNALAGGGSFLTLPALMFVGLDAHAANITSCVALFPAQLASGWASRKLAAGVPGLSLRALFSISVIGGAIGAGILLLTSKAAFARLVPWLVLAATAIFAWGAFFRKPGSGSMALGTRSLAATQFFVAAYGGYFGGGVGFLMLATLTAAGQDVRAASATKNILAGFLNGGAVALFVLSPDLFPREATIVALGATIGGVAGARLLRRIDPNILRGIVLFIGAALTVGLFLRTG